MRGYGVMLYQGLFTSENNRDGILRVLFCGVIDDWYQLLLLLGDDGCHPMYVSS